MFPQPETRLSVYGQIHQYQPKRAEDLSFHEPINRILWQLAKSKCNDVPHLMLHGPAGAGKRTRIRMFLRSLFEDGVEKRKVDQMSFKYKKRLVEIATVTSRHHVEITPSDVGNDDRLVVQQAIVNMASAKKITASMMKKPEAKRKKTSNVERPFRVVVVYDADKLTLPAQHALRRTMENHTHNCRLVLCCERVSKIIGAIKSRCLLIRVPAPSEVAILNVLHTVMKQQNLQLSDEMARRIVASSNRNLTRAVLMLEACKIEHYPFLPGQLPRHPDYMRFIEKLAFTITKEQSPQCVLQARELLYDLLVHLVPPTMVLTALFQFLCLRMDDGMRHQLTHWVAHYDSQMVMGTKAIFHLEAFVIRFMAIYKRRLASAL